MENQLPQITYLFGAGASAQALPTIKGLPERIKFVKNYIEEKYIYEEEDTLDPTKKAPFKKNDAKDYLLMGLDKLYDFSHNHSTIDTYAKKLRINSNSNEINELCFFLALYFNIEQKIVGVDPRYDTFLISIIDSNPYKFPENLKFLNWNYDLQMEIAHGRLSGRNNHDISYSLFNTEGTDLKKNKFSSVKINGSCNFKGRFSDLLPLINGILMSECLKDDLDFALSYGYLQIKNRQRVYEGNININFAWYQTGEFINKMSELHNETEILVVIGYSFPFFNREIDRNIIRNMANLKKIYIQDLVPENVKSRFLSILPDWKKRDIKIIPVNDVTEFFLPPEL